MSFKFRKMKVYGHKTAIWTVLIAFSCSLVLWPVPQAEAQTVLNLPIPGAMVPSSPVFHPAVVEGITLHPDNPLKFDFIVDAGDDNLQGEALRKEASKLIKYFLATLTIPKNDLWVNLSPYEQNRVIPEDFGYTQMGRDLLAQDYMLKQLTASMMHPQDELGQAFWDRVYQKAQEAYGTTEIPLNTFNKIWIIPEKAVVYEHEQSAFVIESHLKVMLEEDYLALTAEQNAQGVLDSQVFSQAESITTEVASDVVREILIPEIEKEVNEGQTFANLRQIYNSMILATWYKKKITNSLLSQVYFDQGKTKGVDTEDKQIKEKIYRQYVESFKKGVFDYIQEDYDPATQQVMPRKYFSGGLEIGNKLWQTLFVTGMMTVTAAMGGFQKNNKSLVSIMATEISVEMTEDQQKSKYIDYLDGKIVSLSEQRQEESSEVDSSMLIKIGDDFLDLNLRDFNVALFNQMARGSQLKQWLDNKTKQDPNVRVSPADIIHATINGNSALTTMFDQKFLIDNIGFLLKEKFGMRFELGDYVGYQGQVATVESFAFSITTKTPYRVSEVIMMLEDDDRITFNGRKIVREYLEGNKISLKDASEKLERLGNFASKEEVKNFLLSIRAALDKNVLDIENGRYAAELFLTEGQEQLNIAQDILINDSTFESSYENVNAFLYKTAARTIEEDVHHLIGSDKSQMEKIARRVFKWRDFYFNREQDVSLRFIDNQGNEFIEDIWPAAEVIVKDAQASLKRIPFFTNTSEIKNPIDGIVVSVDGEDVLVVDYAALANVKQETGKFEISTENLQLLKQQESTIRLSFDPKEGGQFSADQELENFVEGIITGFSPIINRTRNLFFIDVKEKDGDSVARKMVSLNQDLGITGEGGNAKIEVLENPPSIIEVQQGTTISDMAGGNVNLAERLYIFQDLGSAHRPEWVQAHFNQKVQPGQRVWIKDNASLVGPSETPREELPQGWETLVQYAKEYEEEDPDTETDNYKTQSYEGFLGKFREVFVKAGQKEINPREVRDFIQAYQKENPDIEKLSARTIRSLIKRKELNVASDDFDEMLAKYPDQVAVEDSKKSRIKKLSTIKYDVGRVRTIAREGLGFLPNMENFSHAIDVFEKKPSKENLEALESAIHAFETETRKMVTLNSSKDSDGFSQTKEKKYFMVYTIRFTV